MGSLSGQFPRFLFWRVLQILGIGVEFMRSAFISKQSGHIILLLVDIYMFTLPWINSLEFGVPNDII